MQVGLIGKQSKLKGAFLSKEQVNLNECSSFKFTGKFLQIGFRL